MLKYTLALLAVLLLTACEKHDSRNQYSERDVGQVTRIQYGFVNSSREVDITGKNHHVGALAGAVAGGAAGGMYTGGGNGKLFTMIGGALVGGVAGDAAEQAIRDHKGIEYIIHKDNGHTVSIVQDKVEGDTVFAPGTYVMIQSTGRYQRVMPADKPPGEKVKHRKKKKSEGDADADDQADENYENVKYNESERDKYNTRDR